MSDLAKIEPPTKTSIDRARFEAQVAKEMGAYILKAHSVELQGKRCTYSFAGTDQPVPTSPQFIAFHLLTVLAGGSGRLR